MIYGRVYLEYLLQSRSAYRRFLFSFLWITGLWSGLIVSGYCGDFVSSWMLGMFLHPVSIVWFILTFTFPYFFTAFAVYLNLPWMLFLLCFMKSFGYAFVFMLYLRICVDIRIVRFCFLIHETIGIPLLLICWHRFLSQWKREFLAELFFWYSISLLLVVIGSFTVSRLLPGRFIL